MNFHFVTIESAVSAMLNFHFVEVENEAFLVTISLAIETFSFQLKKNFLKISLAVVESGCTHDLLVPS